jgi:hypothetical protein
VKQADWLESVCGLAANVASAEHGLHSLKNIFFGLWSLFSRAPQAILTQFELAANGLGIESGGKMFAKNLIANDPLIFPSPAAGPKEVTQAAAQLLRGLEHALITLGIAERAPRTSEELIAQYGGLSGYVLPFKPTFRQPKEWPSFFARSGLAFLRCIPRTLSNGIEVELVIRHQTTEMASPQCVAHLFEGVIPLGADGIELNFESGGEFVFSDVGYSQPLDFDARFGHLLADKEGGNLHVFPELTIPPEQRKMLQKSLRQKRWLDGQLAGYAPSFVVGGSWHEKNANETYSNCAPVYDGNGNFLGSHKKQKPYSHGTLVEAICPSNTVLVVASPQLSFAVSICLDFCQSGEAHTAYDELDVDLVVVTSMGGETTIEAHTKAADRIWQRRKTATFVCQQREKDENLDSGVPMLGYVGVTPISSDLEFARKVSEPVTAAPLPSPLSNSQGE